MTDTDRIFIISPDKKGYDGDDGQASAFTIDYVEVAEERMPAVLRDAGFHARLASGNGKSLVEFAREEGDFTAVIALRHDGTMVLYSTCESVGIAYEDIAKPETVQAAVDAFRNWRNRVDDAYLAFFESLYGKEGASEARENAVFYDDVPFETAFFGVMEDGSMRQVVVRFACVAERYAEVCVYRVETTSQDDGFFPDIDGDERETHYFSSNEELAAWARETFAGVERYSRVLARIVSTKLSGSSRL